MKPIVAIIFLFAACSEPKPTSKKYFLKLELETGSMLDEKREIEFKTDSVIALTNVDAFDSLMLKVYGWQYADSVARQFYVDRNIQGVYDKWGNTKVKSIKLYNYEFVDITKTIPDSAKLQSAKRWHIKSSYFQP